MHDDTLFDNLEGTIKWLNTKPDVEKEAAVKAGLRKAIYEPKKDQNNKVLISPNELI